ncbi:MAG: phenylalanine--tRNA ligase beta subunit-related protein [Thermodesulfobacteriota bacterium]|nr:phenylalanine--tRNA ligase beta subunit-related protein [Thermodesulfobacteriota bacterium]
MKKIIIKDAIFDLFPDFYRGVVLVKDITNQKSNKRIKKLLKKEIDRQVDIDESKDSRILAWDEAHRKMGSNPDTHFPSIKYLIQSMRPNRSLPFINSVVALFNYISLKYILPCGGDDISQIKSNLVLGIADGTETFVPLGREIEENPYSGEVIYYDDYNNNVMCRRWNWRNGDITRIEIDSKNIILNIDCLPPSSPDIGNKARDELAELLKLHCNAEVETMHLNYGTREIDIL